MAVLATLSFAPALGVRSKPVSVAAFEHKANALKIMGRTRGAPLDLRPYAALFPKHIDFAWVYAEWVDWLEASLLEEHISFEELRRRLGKPTMQAVKIQDVSEVSGDLPTLVDIHFAKTIHWPTDLSSFETRRLIDQQIFSLIGEMAETQGMVIVEDGPTIGWDLAIRGALTGMVATKISGLREAPLTAISRILRGLPVRGADKYLVVTDMPNLVEPLAQRGVEVMAFSDPQFLTKLAAWLASLGRADVG